jgi:predicted alpha/beta-hydrolase family hydrolase
MRLVIAPGASGSAATMAPYVDGLRSRGMDARAIDIPKGRAEQAVAVYRDRSAVDAHTMIGGQSYGGRVASLLAATGVPVAGLVLFCYPLHRPGHPEWEPRTEHWPEIGCPVLMLSGDADPFARVDLLRRAVAERLPLAELVVYPRIGHGLGPVLADALDRIAGFMEARSGVTAADRSPSRVEGSADR